MKNTCIYDSVIGPLLISTEDGAVTELSFATDKTIENLKGNGSENETQISACSALMEVTKQLDEYFDGKRKDFDIKVNPKGTQFQERVWAELLKIPYGETCSYKDIAVRIGSEKAYRAVGGANNKNPVSIIIPCHRVIGHNKKLTGYGGGLDIKEKLLDLEKSNDLKE